MVGEMGGTDGALMSVYVCVKTHRHCLCIVAWLQALCCVRRLLQTNSMQLFDSDKGGGGEGPPHVLLQTNTQVANRVHASRREGHHHLLDTIKKI